MVTALSEQRLDTDHDLTLDVEHRSLLVQFYLDRLERLLAGSLRPSTGLTSAEQRRLHSRAVIATVRALTALGEGPAASASLRWAGRR